MGLFSKFFNTTPSSENSTKPDILFGRYSDRNKTKEQLDNWAKSVDFYKEKKYNECFAEFFKYLKDSKIDNVKFYQNSNRIDFEIIQGSKIVKGYIDEKNVFAEAEIVKFEQPNVAVMRKLLNENYYLWFSKFTIRDNYFTLRHSSNTIEAHPSSLYFSLREVATVADSFDDVLVSEFPFLQPVNINHIQEISENEKNIKIKYLREWITSTLQKVNDLSQDNFTGARSFHLLTLTYKIYYLIAPEGTLLDDLRFIQSIFFRQSDSTDVERNFSMIEEFKKILQKSDTEILKSLYKVKATFSVVKPTHFSKVREFIKDEIEKINWYRERKHYDIQLIICEYIVASSYFSQGLEPVIANIFHIFWQVLNFKYFEELGFKEKYCNSANEQLNPTVIQSEIEKIIIAARPNYPKLQFNYKKLNYSSKHEFATSFLYEFLNCDFDV